MKDKTRVKMNYALCIVLTVAITVAAMFLPQAYCLMNDDKYKSGGIIETFNLNADTDADTAAETSDLYESLGIAAETIDSYTNADSGSGTDGGNVTRTIVSQTGTDGGSITDSDDSSADTKSGTAQSSGSSADKNSIAAQSSGSSADKNTSAAQSSGSSADADSDSVTKKSDPYIFNSVTGIFNSYAAANSVIEGSDSGKAIIGTASEYVDLIRYFDIAWVQNDNVTEDYETLLQKISVISNSLKANSGGNEVVGKTVALISDMLERMNNDTDALINNASNVYNSYKMKNTITGITYENNFIYAELNLNLEDGKDDDYVSDDSIYILYDETNDMIYSLGIYRTTWGKEAYNNYLSQYYTGKNVNSYDCDDEDAYNAMFDTMQAYWQDESGSLEPYHIEADVNSSYNETDFDELYASVCINLFVGEHISFT